MIVFKSRNGAEIQSIGWFDNESFTGEPLALVKYQDYTWEWQPHSVLHKAGIE